MAHKAYDKMTTSRLRELLSYDPQTGIFRRLKAFNRCGRSPPGSVSGSLTSHGYRRVYLDGYRYRMSRLAWLYVHGHWPPGDLDHINGIRDDDRIENLRVATQAQNSRNSCGWSGRLKGVYPQRKNSKNPWYAAIRVNQQLILLGSFPTQEEAHAAYVRAAKVYFGDFACPGRPKGAKRRAYAG